MAGKTFGTQKGSHLKVYFGGRQTILPMHGRKELKTVPFRRSRKRSSRNERKKQWNTRRNSPRTGRLAVLLSRFRTFRKPSRKARLLKRRRPWLRRPSSWPSLSIRRNGPIYPRPAG